MAVTKPWLRVAGKADVTELVRLYVAHLTYHEPFDSRYRPSPEADYARAWRGYLADRDERTLVAATPDGLVGFARCRLVRPPLSRGQRVLAALLLRPLPTVGGQVIDFFVQDDHRRAGVGRALLAGAVAWFREHHAPTMHLGVMAENEAGLAFWKAMGLEPYRLEMQCRIEVGEGPSADWPTPLGDRSEGT